jgi:hypothetical protein
LTACRAANIGAAAGPSLQAEPSSANPCSGYTCDGPGARLNVEYSYRLSTHCGVLATRFDGREFYVDAIDPLTVTSGLNNPEDLGSMTLTSSHVAVFQTSTGNLIRFVDSPPGVIGQPYPFRVFVLSGGNQVVDRRFAGRLWRAQGILPGVVGPPYGNGQDGFTIVDGTMTLTGPDAAVFKRGNGAQVQFVLEAPLGCD